MYYVPTLSGLITAGIISFIILLILWSRAPRIRLAQGSRQETTYLSIISLMYYFFWFSAILIAESMFCINLTPVMSNLAIFSIILPYIAVIFLHVFGFTWILRW